MSERTAFDGMQAAGLLVYRAGWPDFLVQDPKTGRLLAVEVKSSCDVVSETQAQIHRLLAQGGIPVLVLKFDGTVLPEEVSARARFVADALSAFFADPRAFDEKVSLARAQWRAMRRATDDSYEEDLAAGGTA